MKAIYLQNRDGILEDGTGHWHGRITLKQNGKPEVVPILAVDFHELDVRRFLRWLA